MKKFQVVPICMILIACLLIPIVLAEDITLNSVMDKVSKVSVSSQDTMQILGQLSDDGNPVEITSEASRMKIESADGTKLSIFVFKLGDNPEKAFNDIISYYKGEPGYKYSELTSSCCKGAEFFELSTRIIFVKKENILIEYKIDGSLIAFEAKKSTNLGWLIWVVVVLAAAGVLFVLYKQKDKLKEIISGFGSSIGKKIISKKETVVKMKKEKPQKKTLKSFLLSDIISVFHLNLAALILNAILFISMIIAPYSSINKGFFFIFVIIPLILLAISTYCLKKNKMPKFCRISNLILGIFFLIVFFCGFRNPINYIISGVSYPFINSLGRAGILPLLNHHLILVRWAVYLIYLLSSFLLLYSFYDLNKNKEPSAESKSGKKFYQKAWFWIIMAIVIIFFFYYFFLGIHRV